MTYTELYPKLVQLGSLIPMDIPLMQPLYPRWYNENARCDYHSDNRGHSTEDCIALKRRVHDLIKAGSLTFENEDVPNMNGNPLPDQVRPKINAVESSPELQVQRDVGVVCMPIEIVHKALFKVGILNGKQEKEKEIEDWEGQYYQHHERSVGHFIDRKSTRLNSSHITPSRMPSSA